MERLINAMCSNIRNYFPIVKIMDDFTIEGGRISLSFLKPGQYFRVLGSVFNDGVWKYDENLMMQDEVFYGIIWSMRVPPDFIALSEEIEAYNQTEASKPNGYESESFGGYSYVKAGGRTVNASPNSNQWEQVFKSRLNRYRKM